MSSGCGDVLNIEDLKTAKKHQLFEAEVITGKQGGVAGGADIDFATNQVTGQTQKTLPAVLRDAGFRPASFTFASGGTLAVGDADLAVLWPAPSGDGNYYAWHGALPKTIPAASTPASTGGVAQGAWLPIYDATIRNDLLLPSGDQMVGTSHRGTLKQDLDAIDRRPDGYVSGITGVLSNGLDVEINTDITITTPLLPLSNQHVSGVGGNLHQSTSTAAGMRIEGADSSNTKDYAVVENLRSTGSTLSTEAGNEGYAVFLRNTKFTKILGVAADHYTGGVAAGTSKSLIIRDVVAHDTTFHPLNPSTRDGRGGYGVITDNINDSLIDGVILDVGPVDDGRHVLYVSTGGYSNTDGNRNFIATNLIGKYLGKDDRNFWGVNIRKSTIFQVGGINIDGSNGGVAFNAENGDISDFILHDLQLDIIKYQDGLGVYGISTPKDVTFLGSRFLITDFNIRVRPKTTSLTGADCVGVSLSYQNGMVTNGVTNVPAAGNPILINDGANNTTISNIHDNILPGYTGTTAAMITFTGSAVNNITVRGVTTLRPMFNRLFVVTDLTVDYQRKVRLVVSGGAVTKLDGELLTGTVTLTTTGMTIAFATHVTQAAIESCVINCLGAQQAIITSYANKVLSINTYTIAGAVLNPQTTPIALNVILSS